MKYRLILVAMLVLILSACSSRRQYIGSSNNMADLSAIDTTQNITRSNAEDILRSYIVDFSIPNPLNGEGAGSSSSQRNDPSHEFTIACRAVLLDDYSTEADIVYNCPPDTLEGAGCSEYRDEYTRNRIREGMFRIKLVMESGFSEKSMEPDHWVFYLETPDGVMIEPSDMVITPVASVDDSVYSDHYRRNMERRVKTRNITFYFDKTTFFGKDLLTGDLPYLVFVIAREQRTVARVAWQLSEMDK